MKNLIHELKNELNKTKISMGDYRGKEKIKLTSRYLRPWAILGETVFKEGKYDILYPIYETKKQAEKANKKEKGIIRQIKINL